MTAIIETAHTLEEADICLFLGDVEVWESSCAEQVRLAKRLTKIKSRPSGAAYAVPHHVDEEHSVTVSGVWTIKHPETPNGAALDLAPGRNQVYRMVISWREFADPRRWVRRTYYGVTHDSFDLSSREMVEFNGERSFDAQYYVEDSGTGAFT